MVMWENRKESSNSLTNSPQRSRDTENGKLGESSGN